MMCKNIATYYDKNTKDLLCEECARINEEIYKSKK